ncbi:ABC transporter permease [Puteibacter caeruleilacunae]|nr:ABC transporter permease [Puteibacter caeruleilacunae]
MILQSLKPAIRQLVKRDTIKWLNIFGLAIGIASAVILTSYIFSEFEIGKTDPNSKNLYLLDCSYGATHSIKAHETIKNNLPGLEHSVAFHSQWGDSYFKINEKTFKAEGLLIGDNSFFDVFNNKVLYGDLSTALDAKESIVITQELAKKLFGDENALGQPILYDSEFFGKMNLTVGAVVENPHRNALVQFKGYLNREAIKHEWYKRASQHWGSQNYTVFCKLTPNADVEVMGEKITDIVKANAPDWFVKDAKSYSFVNISDLHFGNIDFWGMFKTNKKSNLLTLGIIGLFLLFIGWINFINLSTAQQERLCRLNSIKKSLGASKGMLIKANILEILPTILITLGIAVVMVVFSYRYFGYFAGTDLLLSDFLTTKALVFSLLFVMITLLICGVFPHWLIDRKYGASNKLRGTLSVFQFAISIGLIISTIAIVKQNQFIQNKDTGYQSENILCLEMKGDVKSKSEVFASKIENYSYVSEITFASRLISDVQQDWGMTLDLNGESKRVKYTALEVDDNFFSFFNIPLVEGSLFGEASETQRHHIFNETALRTFGIDSIQDARIASYDNATGDVIGVVRDFNFRSLHLPITPLGFVKKKPQELRYIYIKINNGSMAAVGQCMANLKADWQELEANWPIDVKFLNESTRILYEQDQKFSKLILIIALLSIFISCIGLLGVSKFIAEKKTKEIGIRKVNGARIREVLTMLNISFIRWIAIAFVIACPVAFYAMNKWLENFAYKTDLSWWIFALSGVLALGIALLTVSWQSWKAATRNPVEALRYE